MLVWAYLVMTAEECPTHIQPMANFDPQRYKGTWRAMYRRQGEDPANDQGKCTTAIYGDHPEGVSVWNMVWRGEVPGQTTRDIKGYARQPDG